MAENSGNEKRRKLVSEPRSGAKPLFPGEPAPLGAAGAVREHRQRTRARATERRDLVRRATTGDAAAGQVPARRTVSGTVVPAGTRRKSTGSGRKSSGKSFTGDVFKIGKPKVPRGSQHVLMAELVAAFVIIAMRAAADYVPASDESEPGRETPFKGQSPIVLIAATMMVFFVLAFLATAGRWTAKFAQVFGGVMVLTLLVNSASELETVAGWAKNIGTTEPGSNAYQEPANPYSAAVANETNQPLGSSLPGGGINLGNAAANNAEQAAIRAGVLSPNATIDEINAFFQSLPSSYGRTENAIYRGASDVVNSIRSFFGL